MLKRYPNLLLLISCLILATLGHGVFLYQWTEEHYMAGVNDGLSQMMPFKHLLYEQYTSGEFFYSFDFGLGAGTFSELSYYFSTSIVFLVTVLFLFLFESVGLIYSLDILFWANAAVFISIGRLCFVLFVTTHLFIYMDIHRLPALLGASIYGISGMYFRHVVYWEFFADAFLWLPLLLLGCEKIFREGKPAWFLLAVSISMFDNFYFAYINFLLTGIYILFRFFIPLIPDEQDRKKILLTFLTAGLIGAGISAISFIPAVYAYLNNHRPPFQQEIPLIDLTDNVLFTSRYILLPAIFVILVFAAYLYRDKTFRLFTLLGIMGILMHHSPLIGSVFNGFSAPQYRWEYFISLVVGGAVAVSLKQLHKFPFRHFVIATALSIGAFALYAGLDGHFKFSSSASLYTLGFLLLTLTLVFSCIRHRNLFSEHLLIGALFLWVLTSANIYQVERLLEDGNVEKVNKELITGEDYDNPEIRTLLSQIHGQEESEIYRIEWMEGVRNNTPIAQDFRGLSAYSSILNKNLLYFYLYDLEIDMRRESVSRYATLGNRANLHSLLQGKYVIRSKGDQNIPYGFTEILVSENYRVYQNSNVLPFARSANTIYTEKELAQSSPLAREHAMLTGVVFDIDTEGQEVPAAQNLIEEFSVEEVESSYEGDVLEVYGETGGIDLVHPAYSSAEGDLYVSFHLVNTAEDQGFYLTVNDYKTSRKSNQSVYKTYVDDITIRVPAEERVKIRVPEGVYELTDLKVHEESYELLESQTAEEVGLKDLTIDGSRVEISYLNNEDEEYLTATIPYERGWNATVNGKDVEVMKANYAFVGVPIENGENNIVFYYRPPFFKLSIIISLLSFVCGILWVFRRR